MHQKYKEKILMVYPDIFLGEMGVGAGVENGQV